MRFVALEKLINLHDGYRREFRLDYHRLLLLQHDGDHHVIEALCPHQEHPLEEGRIENGTMMCPLHGYRFSLQTGTVLHSSREPCRPLRVWPVAYEGADVGLMWEEG
ncbi:MAG: Rieske (2Fe-2S) protein [Halieaceae bacterium]|jgi:nitrite reductase/ring-hydroxylating ferredoxin subunit|nr:Rieske (2Fe-2S) protein [Halieaceae bacterium]